MFSVSVYIHLKMLTYIKKESIKKIIIMVPRTNLNRNITGMKTHAKIEQKKLNLKSIDNSENMIIDMHVHTQYSDTYTKVESLFNLISLLSPVS